MSHGMNCVGRAISQDVDVSTSRETHLFVRREGAASSGEANVLGLYFNMDSGRALFFEMNPAVNFSAHGIPIDLSGFGFPDFNGVGSFSKADFPINGNYLRQP